MSPVQLQKPDRVTEAENQVHIYSLRIESLLKDYLCMIDEYTSNRKLLEQVHRDAFMDLAKANIDSIDIPYCGQPSYPSSMRAARFVDTNQAISTHLPDEPADTDSVQQCALVKFGEVVEEKHKRNGSIFLDGASEVNEKLNKLVLNKKIDEGREGDEDHHEKGDAEEDASQDSQKDKGSKKHKRYPSTEIISSVKGVQEKPSTKPLPGKEHREKQEGEDEGEQPNPPIPKPVDPLRWFGFFIPQSLKKAQSAEIRSVEEIVPKLANINAKMLHIEIAIRRAKKRRLGEQQIIDRYYGSVAEN